MDSSLYQNSYPVFIAVASLLFVVLYQIFIKKLINKNSESRRIPPGSTGLPFIGETLNFMSAIKSEYGFYDFVRVRRARYGNCFKTNIFGGTHVFVSSTSSAKAIMNNESGKFTKRYIKSVAELVGSKSILCAPLQHHKLIRGRLSNLVSSTNLSLFVKQFDQLVVNALATWEHRQSVVVIDEALKIATASMCKMLMSLDENGPKTELLMNEVAFLCKALISFPIKLPGTRFYKGLQARKRIMALIENEIRDRRNGPAGQHDDLLERLLDRDQSTHDNSSYALDDQYIKDNILTVIIAGQDTTASSITWMVKYLDENPDVLDKLRKEHLEFAKKNGSNEPLTLEALNDMSFASKVVKESLRKASVVAWFPRLVLDDCEVEGYDIKKGWSVNIDAKQVHNDPTVYNDPYAFNPSRFDQDESKVPYSFLAFGMGARTCLGINMAKSMMLVFLHRLITTYRWELTNTDTSVEKMAMFTRLRSGCPMTVKRITTQDD